MLDFRLRCRHAGGLIAKIDVGSVDRWVGYIGGDDAFMISEAWAGGDGVFHAAGAGNCVDSGWHESDIVCCSCDGGAETVGVRRGSGTKGTHLDGL